MTKTIKLPNDDKVYTPDDFHPIVRTMLLGVELPVGMHRKTIQGFGVLYITVAA